MTHILFCLECKTAWAYAHDEEDQITNQVCYDCEYSIISEVGEFCIDTFTTVWDYVQAYAKYDYELTEGLKKLKQEFIWQVQKNNKANQSHAEKNAIKIN